MEELQGVSAFATPSGNLCVNPRAVVDKFSHVVAECLVGYEVFEDVVNSFTRSQVCRGKQPRGSQSYDVEGFEVLFEMDTDFVLKLVR